MTLDHGMNIDEVKALATHLTSVTRQLGEITQQLNARVSSTSWVGSDATRFKNEWWPGHRTHLQKIQRDLEGFSQSAHNNAAEQARASEAHDGGSVVASAAPAVAVVAGTAAAATGPAAAAPAASSVTAAGRDWREVQTKYDAWAASRPGGQTRFADPNESQYQCTGWANYRWHELGYTGPPIGGNGGEMAAHAGATSSAPSLHAMASYGAGYGHVMIVEEVSPDGARIRVSEMNTGISEGDPTKWDSADLVAHPNEFSDGRWITRQPDGKFYGSKGNEIQFAALPG